MKSIGKSTLKNSKPTPPMAFVLMATLIGGLVRCFYVFQANFPLNDGGMFYTMIRDLQAAHYYLPAFTTYNHASIPFDYPPLGFYLGAVLNSVFHIDILQILRFVPLVFSIATIPAFYPLAEQLLPKKSQQICAVFVFALISSTYTWQIMGGGLTRSLAFFFTILAMGAYLKWAKQHRWLDYLLLILFTAFTALSHLEMLWMLGLSFVLFFFLFQRDWKQFGLALLAGIGVLILTAPWWATVIHLHGLSPFLQALHSGGFNLIGPIGSLFVVNPGQDLVQSLFTLLAFIGAIVLLKEKDWTLPVWWLAFMLLDPRSSLRSVTLPIALMAGAAINESLLWVSRNLSWKNEPVSAADSNSPDLANGWIKVILALVLFSAMFNDMIGYFSSGSLLASLNDENRQAMKWVKENTALDSHFLVVDYPNAWHSDMVGEWFPALAERSSLLTAQGKEWLPEHAQVKTIQALSAVNACQMEGLACLESWENQSKLDFDYVYFSENAQTMEKTTKYTSVVEAQISVDSNYRLVYSNEDVRIYRKLN